MSKFKSLWFTSSESSVETETRYSTAGTREGNPKPQTHHDLLKERRKQIKHLTGSRVARGGSNSIFRVIFNTEFYISTTAFYN